MISYATLFLTGNRLCGYAWTDLPREEDAEFSPASISLLTQNVPPRHEPEPPPVHTTTLRCRVHADVTA